MPSPFTGTGTGWPAPRIRLAPLRRRGRRVGGPEAISPTRVAQLPAELVLGLVVRGAAGLGRHRDHGFAREQPREPARKATGRLGAEHLGEHRQPLAYRGGLVVDDVVEAGAVAFEREHGRRGGVVQVDPRPDPATVTDCRELPLAHRLDQPIVGRAVEDPVAKRDSAGVADRLVEVAHRFAGLVRRRNRCGIERVVLALHGSALARVAVVRVALGEEPAHARLAGGGEQRVGPLGPQPVRLMEAAVEVLEVAQVCQRRRLVNDRLGLGFEHRLAHRAGVKQVEGDRLRAERPHAVAASRRPERAGHLVASIDQLGNEPGADRTARACNEDSHRELLLVCHIVWISGV